jgi:hypothetical protein
MAEEAGFRTAICATGKSTRTSASLSNRLSSGEDAIGTNLISIGCEMIATITDHCLKSTHLASLYNHFLSKNPI